MLKDPAEFGPFSFDPVSLQLQRGGVKVQLGARVGALLAALIEARGNVVTKEQLLDVAWPGLIVEEGNLAVQIAALRKVLGEQQSGQEWIVTVPRLGYRMPIPAPAVEQVEQRRPTIAVLPFLNLSADPEQEYFADGIVEDITTALSRFKSLAVVSRNSARAYKGRSLDIRQVGDELGVRYVLEGAVRSAGGQLRVNAQLVETESGTQIWANRFDGPTTALFDVQDQITDGVVGAIQPSITQAEVDRARSKRPDNLDAYDLFLRALPHTYANTPAGNDEALRLLNEALRLDPNYACAHGYAAWGYEQRFLRGGFHPEDRTTALKHANFALSIGADDPLPLCMGAFVHATITHDYNRAINALDMALKLNGNSAFAYGLSAMVHMFNENYECSCDHASKALRLSPFDPMNYHAYLALAWVCLFTDRFEEAVTYSALGIQVNPDFSILHASLVASYVNLDRLVEARAAAARLLEVAPGWTISQFVRMDVVRPQLMESLAVALRRAGLPE